MLILKTDLFEFWSKFENNLRGPKGTTLGFVKKDWISIGKIDFLKNSHKTYVEGEIHKSNVFFQKSKNVNPENGSVVLVIRGQSFFFFFGGGGGTGLIITQRWLTNLYS